MHVAYDAWWRNEPVHAAGSSPFDLGEDGNVEVEPGFVAYVAGEGTAPTTTCTCCPALP